MKPTNKNEKTKETTILKGFFNSVSNQNYILIGVCFLLYFNTLFFNYTLDDRMLISENQFTKNGVSGLSSIFTNDAFTGFFGTKKNLVEGGRYRPLTHAMFALEFQVFGLNPFIGHFINIILYTILILLIFKILTNIFKDIKLLQQFKQFAFVITLLYAVHPMHTEVVANIKGRDEIMSFLGALASLWFAIKYIETHSLKYLLFIFISFFIGLLSKENAITFILIIPFTLYFFKKAPFTKLAIIVFPMLISTLIFLFLRHNALGFWIQAGGSATELLNNPFLGVTFTNKLATLFYTWLIYFKLFLFPHPLTHDYYPFQIAIQTFSNPLVLLSVCICAFLAFIALKGIIKRNIVSYGLLFFGLSFSISSNLFFNIGTFMNERFLFAPMLGLLIFVMAMINKYFSKFIHSKSGLIVLSIVLVLFSVKTFSRNFAWQDDFTLFTTDVKTSVNSTKCNVSAGGVLVEKAAKETPQKKEALYRQAVIYLTKAVEIYPKNFAGWILLGNAYNGLDDFQNTSLCFQNAYAINPYKSEALNNMKFVAQEAQKKGLNEISIHAYKQLLIRDSTNIDYVIQLADIYSKINKVDTSLIMLNGLLEKYPTKGKVLGKIGEIYGRVYNNIQLSKEYLLKAVQFEPNDLSVNENLGIVYGLSKDYEKSIGYFNKALSVEPENSRILMNLANTYYMMGDRKKGDEFKQKVKATK
ncbi:MAG: glycosyltransferase family 39 protein [Bacteroidota bacterium]